MYVIRNKQTGKIVYIHYERSSTPVDGKTIYETFDPETMEIGWTEKRYIPTHFKINNEGRVEELDLDEQIELGCFKIQSTHKVVKGRVVSKTLDELLKEKIISIEQVKKDAISRISAIAFEKRQELIPDYKLANSAIDIYEDKTLESYKATIQAFREEYYRLKTAIENANTIDEIEANHPRFPTEIMGE